MRLDRSIREAAERIDTARSRARRSLLRAAIEVFGEAGFESATTREIAKRSAQNSAAIAYYFGGKAQLYEAVIEHVVTMINERIGMLLQSAERFLEKETWPREQALSFLQQMLEASVANSKDPEIVGITHIIVREQTNPSSAFDLLYKGVLGRLQRTGTRLMAVYVTGDPDHADFRLRFHALLGQALAFRHARATILRSAGWKDIDARQEAAIRDVVLDQTLLILDGLRARHKATGR